MKPRSAPEVQSYGINGDDLLFLRRKSSRQVPRDAPPIRAADVFCGCGGLSEGLREACCDYGYRFESVWAADTDSHALDVYRKNFNPLSDSDLPVEEWVPGKFGQAKSVTEKQLEEKIGHLDWLLAGPPCQGHSTLNNRTRHNDARNYLYSKVGRLVEIVMPEHVLIENVPAVVHSKEKSIHLTKDHLKRLGYSVDTCVVDLSRIGVPQRRKRHILVGSRSRKPELLKWLDENDVETRSVRWAIGDLEVSTSASVFDTASELSEVNRRRVNYLFNHGRYDLPNQERPHCHRDGEHTYKSMYGRLAWDDPSQTITTGFGSPGQGRYIHPSQRRTLTPHEAARLQFFPDDFDFGLAKFRTVLARLIGNAVPPKLSWAICREFLDG